MLKSKDFSHAFEVAQTPNDINTHNIELCMYAVFFQLSFNSN